MAYCTQQDIINHIGFKTVVSLSNDVANSDAPDSAVVSDLIDHSDTIIDSKVGTRYTVPFTTTPKLIKAISTHLTIASLFNRRPTMLEIPKYWIDQEKEANDDLAAIAKGTLKLNVGTVASTSGSISASAERIDFYNEDNSEYNF